MPRNANIDVGRTPVQLTVNNVSGLFVSNEGPGSVILAGSASAAEPPMVGPVLEPGVAIPASVSLAEMFPGVAGVARVFAVAAGPAPAVLFVSHA